jgi:outer membrane receptor protein involved in Fe transport
MIKRFFLILFLALASLALFAQQNVNGVRGIVVEEDGTPVMYASVTMMQNGKATAGALTDTTGLFVLKGIFKGSYQLKITSIGHEDVLKDLMLSDVKSHNVGQIVMTERATQLDGVVVTGRSADKTVTLEKTSINAAASMSAATGSVLDMLRGSSAVSVDGAGRVSIRGNNNVLILVDGVPTALDGLGGIPAVNVQSIDIVTSPDVKYDSEGTGGIINIVSKKQAQDAFALMASANYGFNNFMNGNLAMSYNAGKWGVRLNYNGKYEKDRIESELHRQFLQTDNSIDQIIEASKKTTGHNIGLNVNYKATKKDVVIFDVKAGFPRMNNWQTFHNHYITAGVPSDKVRETDITFNREMLEGSLTYRHIYVPGKREISTSASLSAINGHRPSYYYEAGQMVQRSKSGGHPRIAAWQLDYMTQMGKGKLETGVKMTYRHNNIDHKMYEYDETIGDWQLSIPLSNDLRHREYIPAAYVMYSSKWGDKLTYKAGLRFEYSHVTLQNDKDRLDESSNCYFLSPNVVLNYRVSQPLQLSFGLSRRISRPTYPQLNPYINLIDNQTYETGNVRLKPEKANKLDFGYSYAGRTVKLNGSAYFNYTQDYISQIAYIDQDVLVTTYINGDQYLNTGYEQNVRWNALQWLGVDLGTNIFYTRSRGTSQGITFRNHGWTNNSSATLNIMPLKGMTIQGQYFVTSPQYFPQFTTKTVHYCNLGVKQQLLKKSLTLSALLTDVFNTRRWDISSDNPVYTLVNNSKNRSRMLWLGISWNFHSFKPAGGQKKQEEDRSVIRLGE